MTTAYTLPDRVAYQIGCVHKAWDVTATDKAVVVAVDEIPHFFVPVSEIDESAFPDHGLFGAHLWESDEDITKCEWYESKREYTAAIRTYRKKAVKALETKCARLTVELEIARKLLADSSSRERVLSRAVERLSN